MTYLYTPVQLVAETTLTSITTQDCAYDGDMVKIFLKPFIYLSSFWGAIMRITALICVRKLSCSSTSMMPGRNIRQMQLLEETSIVTINSY